MPRKGFSNKNIEKVIEGPGVYKFFNSQGALTYVGKAKNLKERLQQHLNEGDIPNIRQFEAKHTKTTRDVERIEKTIIHRSKPLHNIREQRRNIYRDSTNVRRNNIGIDEKISL